MSLTQKVVETHQSVAPSIFIHLVPFRHLHGGRRPPFGRGAGKPVDGLWPWPVLCTRGVRTAADVWLALWFLPSGTEDKRSFNINVSMIR